MRFGAQDGTNIAGEASSSSERWVAALGTRRGSFATESVAGLGRNTQAFWELEKLGMLPYGTAKD
jgi:hypothetical protein